MFVSITHYAIHPTKDNPQLYNRRSADAYTSLRGPGTALGSSGPGTALGSSWVIDCWPVAHGARNSLRRTLTFFSLAQPGKFETWAYLKHLQVQIFEIILVLKRWYKIESGMIHLGNFGLNVYCEPRGHLLGGLLLTITALTCEWEVVLSVQWDELRNKERCTGPP